MGDAYTTISKRYLEDLERVRDGLLAAVGAADGWGYDSEKLIVFWSACVDLLGGGHEAK